MGPLVVDYWFYGTFVVRLAFYARLGSPKITISQFITWAHRPRDDLITRMRETMKNWDHTVNCEHSNKSWGL